VLKLREWSSCVLVGMAMVYPLMVTPAAHGGSVAAGADTADVHDPQTPYHLGAVRSDEALRRVIRIRNEQPVAVRLTGSRSSCAACLSVLAMRPEVVGPGEIMEITVEVRPQPRVEAFGRTLHVLTDHPDEPAIRISISAEVRDHWVFPEHAALVHVNEAGERGLTFWVLSTMDSPWEVEVDPASLPRGYRVEVESLAMGSFDRTMLTGGGMTAVVGRGRIVRDVRVADADVALPEGSAIRILVREPAMDRAEADVIELPMSAAPPIVGALSKAIMLGIVREGDTVVRTLAIDLGDRAQLAERLAALTVTPSCDSLKISEGSIARGTTIAVFEVRWTAPATRGMVEEQMVIRYGEDRDETIPVRGFVR